MKKPSVLVPYSGPDSSGSTTDTFIYLRPETNGVATESAIMRVIYEYPRHSSSIKMVYFANYPGSYIKHKHIIEHHYSHKLNFTKSGKKAFTDQMKKCFENFYHTEFSSAEIIGAYDAMKKFGIDEEELFNLWVDKDDFFSIYGNTIKKYKDTYIINYDIPALLHRKYLTSDIAVMVFRLTLQWEEFRSIIDRMQVSLREKGIIDSRHPLARVFHFTRSPFEQILDGLEYLYNSNNKDPLNISFYKFLIEKGLDEDIILSFIKNPVIRYKTENGVKEDSVFEKAEGMNYEEAFDFIRQIIQ